MCSSDFFFRKYKQDSAFRASGVLQLAKTGPLVTKNSPLLRLLPSDASDVLKVLHTLLRQLYKFAYFGRARNVAHFDLNWPTLKLEKKFVRASPKPKFENYKSEDHRLQ